MFSTNFLFMFSCIGDLVTKREVREEKQGVGHFEDFEAFSLVASIFKYSSTSSTRVSSFFPFVLDALL